VLPRALSVLLLLAGITSAHASDVELLGHTKLRAVAASYPADSLARDVIGSESLDVTGDLRLNADFRRDRWSADAAYQLVALRWDTLPFSGTLPDDGRRLLDMTSVISENGRNALVHRIDRLSAGFASEKTVLRIGRQALSWGNGLFYAPMDLVNPFDPAAVDTEYKAGDDMVYVQRLRGNGDDLQAAWVVRRNPESGAVDADQATTAIKYHGFSGNGEYDVLVARSYGSDVLGVGTSLSIGGAVLRGDVVVTRTDRRTTTQAVVNLTYSWNRFGRNMSGGLEYYFNGFGQRAGRYDPGSLAANPELAARLERGESFTLGRHYLAASVLVEMTPLWNLTPMVFANIADPSALLQVVSNYSLADNMALLASLALPLGPGGTEFGGIDSGVPGRYLSSDGRLFVQFAWYF